MADGAVDNTAQDKKSGSQDIPVAPTNATGRSVEPLMSSPPAAPRRAARGLTLSAKLLALTAIAVMIAEVFVFVPSIANYRKTWLMERLQAAQIAAVAADAAEGGMLPERLKDELLTRASVRSIAVKYANSRQLIMREAMPPRVDDFYDLMDVSWVDLIGDAIAALARNDDRLIAVRGKTQFGRAEFVEVVLAEAPLREAMYGFALNILLLSIIISLLTAGLVYFALNALMVRPMERMVASMMAFGAAPEDASRIMSPSSRSDEVGTAERELARMQGELRTALHQRSRLAALGLAVSKINHDLRNMLANAQLISDRLASVEDPMVQRVTPKLVTALDRAIRLCNDTLQFGQARERPPRRERIPLASFAVEVGESLGLPRGEAAPISIAYTVDVPEHLVIAADPDHLFRVLGNLVRNAAQVLDAEAVRAEKRGGATGEGPRGAQSVTVSAAALEAEWTDGAVGSPDVSGVRILVSDTGPGVPEKARDALFEAFRGTARPGGTGLGLAISAELVRAHGGTIRLLETPSGASFEIELPAGECAPQRGQDSGDQAE